MHSEICVIWSCRRMRNSKSYVCCVWWTQHVYCNDTSDYTAVICHCNMMQNRLISSILLTFFLCMRKFIENCRQKLSWVGIINGSLHCILTKHLPYIIGFHISWQRNKQNGCFDESVLQYHEEECISVPLCYHFKLDTRANNENTLQYTQVPVKTLCPSC